MVRALGAQCLRGNHRIVPGGRLGGCCLSEFRTSFDGHVFRFEADWIPTLGLNIAFRLDGLSLLFSTLILGIGLLVILYARYYLSDTDQAGRFYAYLLLFMASMAGVVLANNLLLLWFFWELTSISSFLLIGYWHHRSDARKGARMALTVTGAGGLALLGGFILIGQTVGSYNIDRGPFKRRTDTPLQPIPHHSPFGTSGCIYQIGPISVSSLATACHGCTDAGQRVSAFGNHGKSGHLPAGATVPRSFRDHELVLDRQRYRHVDDALRRLPGTVQTRSERTAGLLHDQPPGVDHAAVWHGTALGAVAAVFHIINHAIFKASLFMAAGIIDHETGSRDMRKLNGLWTHMPITATLAMVAAAAMAGVPLLNGFLSKEMFFAETLHQSTLGSISWMVPVFATIGGAFSVAYSLRFIHDVFFNGEPKNLPKTPHEPPRYMRVPVEILVALCLIVGVFPEYTVGDVLASASTVVLGDRLPEYHLHIWHGLNLPLLMSVLALLGGGLLYYNRQRLFRLQTYFPERNESQRFDDALTRLQQRMRRFLAWFDNGSLQRAVFWLFFVALVFSMVPLMELDMTIGARPQIPIDFVMIAGATLLCVSSVATVVWHHQRLIAILLLSVVGMVVAIAFALFSAPDLALTQLSVEVVTIVLLLLALHFLPQRIRNFSSPNRIIRDASVAVLIGGVVGTITFALITRPLESISGYFVDNAKALGGGTNIVNVILVDFRGFDTYGEISVLAIAALGISKLVEHMRPVRSDADADGLRWASDKHPMMLSVVSQALLAAGHDGIRLHFHAWT
jgi:multicomponent K+:H+ antiporter subunit A